MDMRWQVQEAKQRFSELLRRAQKDGPQAVTKHGREVAYVVDVAWYHEKAGLALDLRHHLLHGPASDMFADLVGSASVDEPTGNRDPITDLVEELTATDNER
jgi:prevent-host-death family protein